MSQATSISMLPCALTVAGAFALFGLFAASAPANAAPMQAPSGVTAPGLQLEDVGYYKRGKKYRQLYADQYYAPNSNYRAYRYEPYGGSDEIRELQRLYPQTNWPPSLRYY